MPSILRPDANVTYWARKKFSFKGKTYTTGDVCPEFDDAYRLETLVRAGFIIPVVKDKSKLPFQFRRTVMTEAVARTKLRLGNPAGDHDGQHIKGNKTTAKLTGTDPNAPELTEPEPDERVYPHDYNTEQVVEYAQEHPEDVVRLIDEEENGKNRKGLLEKLNKLFEENEEKAGEYEKNFEASEHAHDGDGLDEDEIDV